MSPRRKKTPFPFLILIGAGLLLIVAAFILAGQNRAAAPAPEDAFEEETYPEIPRVSLAEAKAAFDQGSALFMDVRSAEAYQGSHISGAINIPAGELDARLGELDKAQWIITYCT